MRSVILQGALSRSAFTFRRIDASWMWQGGPGDISASNWPAIHPPAWHHHRSASLCEIANKWIDAYELSDRFTAVPADLFEGAYPDGADAPGPHFARLKRQ